MIVLGQVGLLFIPALLPPNATSRSRGRIRTDLNALLIERRRDAHPWWLSGRIGKRWTQDDRTLHWLTESELFGYIQKCSFHLPYDYKAITAPTNTSDGPVTWLYTCPRIRVWIYGISVSDLM